MATIVVAGAGSVALTVVLRRVANAAVLGATHALEDVARPHQVVAVATTAATAPCGGARARRQLITVAEAHLAGVAQRDGLKERHRHRRAVAGPAIVV